LAAGEIGFESDTNKFKIGTGSTAWASLPYASNISPLTTKGDLYTYSTDNARLAVGANGETLVADSSTSTGLRYNPQNVLVNPVINGGFDIWQRGTSKLNGQNSYVADRWIGSQATVTTFSRQNVSDSTNLPNIQYCLRAQRTSGSAQTDQMNISQSMETVNSIPYAGKPITFSFYARAGANYSATSSLLNAQVTTGTGTDQNVYTVGYTGGVTLISQNATLTTTWQRFAYTGTVASNVTEIGLTFVGQTTGTAGANDWYEITGIQIDVGTYTASSAPTFRRTGGTIQGELAACQRYFQLITGFGDTAGVWYTTSAASLSYKCPVLMRTTPTPTFNTTYTNAVDQVGIALRTPTGYSAAYSGITGITFLATGASGATIGYPAIYVGGTHQLSAEL
jgi:hypothetical protein